MNTDHHESSAGFRFSGGMPNMFVERGFARTGSGELAHVDAAPLPGGNTPPTPRAVGWRARLVYATVVSAVAWFMSAVDGAWWMR